MGGIVEKKALLRSKGSNQVDIALIASDNRGVIFMGTPNCGSKHEDFAACLLKIVSLVHSNDTSLVSTLMNQDAMLQELEHSFQQLLAKRRGTDAAIEVRCFFETVPMDNKIGTVVPSHSAAPPAYENSVPVDANHVGMTKFSGGEDQTYKNVLAELRRMTKLAKERKDAGTEEDKPKSRTTHIGNNDRGALANYADVEIKGTSGGTIHNGKSYLLPPSLNLLIMCLVIITLSIEGSWEDGVIDKPRNCKKCFQAEMFKFHSGLPSLHSSKSFVPGISVPSASLNRGKA